MSTGLNGGGVGIAERSEEDDDEDTDVFVFDFGSCIAGGFSGSETCCNRVNNCKFCDERLCRIPNVGFVFGSCFCSRVLCMST